MSSRDYLKHVVSTSEPTNSALGDEYYNPSSNKLLKRLAVNGTAVSFVPILLNPSPDSTPVVITSEGKVGIGTNAPEGSLHIKRQDTVSFTEMHTDFIIENPGLGNARIFLKTLANNRNWEFFADDNDGTFGIYDGVGVARRFTIMPDGNIGIGASSPVAKLDVNAASGYVDARVRSGSNQTYMAADGTASYFGTYSNIPVIFSTNNINRGGISNAGVWSLGAPAGSESLRVTPVASAVNRVEITGNTTGNGVNIYSRGSDAAVGMYYVAQGTAFHTFITNWPSNAVQFNVAHTANAVNNLQVTGGATGGVPLLQTTGSDTNVPLTIVTKGTGYINLQTGGGTQFVVTNTASAVNYLQVTGGPTAFGPEISAQGSATNLDMYFKTKGTGSFIFYTNGADRQLQITHTASAVNYLQATGSATGTRVSISSQGSDTNLGINYIAKGAEGHAFFSNGGSAIHMFVSPTASAVNYLQVTGAATGGSPALSAQGTDANISLVLTPKGTGIIALGAAVGSESVRVVTVTSSVNYLRLLGGTTGNGPTISVQGSDTNIAMFYSTKGTGQHDFYTNLAAPILQFRIAHTASAVNYFQATGAATGASPVFSAQGSDANIGIGFSSKGTFGYAFSTNNGGSTQFTIAHATSAVNYLQATGGATGAAATLLAQGSDTNIDITLTPKGNGYVVVDSAYSPNLTLTDAATIAWNTGTAGGQVATFTFVSTNRTMGAPTNLKNGGFYALAVIQNAGSNTLTWNAVFKWAGGTAPTLSTAAGAKDYFVFRSDGTNLYQQGISQAVA
jgi:hypothetical protein